MSKTPSSLSDEARRKASSPEARAKAAATRKANREAKLAQQEMPLDAIPDRVMKKKYERKAPAPDPNTETIRQLLTLALTLLK